MAARTLCLWCPDWPVVAARLRGDGPTDAPVVVLAQGRVLACSAEARAHDVTIGLRRREVEVRAPGVVVLEVDPAGDARAFEPVARAVEALAPRLALERPGLLSFPTRGPSRYFGGDEALVARVLDVVRDTAVPDARVGVADGVFAARLAARRGVLVPVDATPTFLAPWPVGALGDEDLASLLCRLGLRTLGDFAALPPGAVLARFGARGLGVHRLARGEDEHPPALTTPPPDLVEVCELDPPAARVDAAAFVAKALADRLLERLAAVGLACTHVVVEAETEHGEHLARGWRHEGALTAATLAERVRWQLDGWLTETGGLTGGLALLRLVPEQVIPATGRQLGFWGGDAAAADRAARVLARVQGILGPEHVVTAVPQGGRTPLERVRWVPWGEPREAQRPVDAVAGPVSTETPDWPGTVPGPSPARVFAVAPRAVLLDAAGEAVTVSSRGEPSAPPARLVSPVLPGGGGEVGAWAGPWAQDVRWWDRRARARRSYWQVVVGETACLVRVERGEAAIEALYD
ncbi:MAG: DNA polymerase Y family protein [Actinobacteria bacterium]|nr:DNA polymerase Y family protein [Actinomycetota bacterium]